MPRIRPAVAADCPAIADIYRHYVENSVATFDLEPLTVEQWVEKRSRIEARGRPFIVIEDDDPAGAADVLGYAYLAVYRGKDGWAYTAEDSIYLRPEAAGRGLGGRLLRALLDATDREVTRNVMAVISEDVPASVALHRKVGFTEIGRSPSVGRKFGRWIGVIYMQYSFADESSPGD